MYASIDPDRLGMEDILRSLGTVLDSHLARRVEIRQRMDGLLVRAEAVASISARLEGTWSRLELLMTHVDLVQAEIAVAARRRAGHMAGPHERSLGMLGHLIDERGLRGLMLSQHPSTGAWLLWHEASEGQGLILTVLTEDALEAAAAATSVARQRLAARGPEARHERGLRTRRLHGRMSALGVGTRESIRVQPGRGMLAHAGAAAEM